MTWAPGFVQIRQNGQELRSAGRLRKRAFSQMGECAAERAILDHFVESGQTQAPRLSTRHNLRVCIASGGPRGPPGKVPVGTGEIPVPAGTDPGEHVCLPKALQTHRL